MHGIVTYGGAAPNIVPALAVAKFYVRAETLEAMKTWEPKVIRCFEAGALATGAGLEIVPQGPRYSEFVTDEEMAAVYRANAEAIGQGLHCGDRGPHDGLDRHGQRVARHPVDPPDARDRLASRRQPPGGLRRRRRRAPPPSAPSSTEPSPWPGRSSTSPATRPSASVSAPARTGTPEPAQEAPPDTSQPVTGLSGRLRPAGGRVDEKVPQVFLDGDEPMRSSELSDHAPAHEVDEQVQEIRVELT